MSPLSIFRDFLFLCFRHKLVKIQNKESSESDKFFNKYD